jgi:hypothetical protein
MNVQLATIIVRGSIYDWYALPVVAFGGIVAGVATRWRFITQRLQGKRGAEWPTVPAIIDIVNVVEQRGGKGGGIVGYLAMLTYFYRNPELQTGEFCRMFNPDEEADAQAWAASYKGCSVTVHVDPRDPTRSVLRKEQL